MRRRLPFMDPLYTPEEKKKIYELSERGLSYTYAFCENVIAGGKLSSYADDKSVMATQKNRMNFVPVSFFVDFLGAALGGEGESAELALGAKVFSVYKNKEQISPITKRGVLFVPAVQCARALGIEAKVLCNEKLIVYGAEELIAEFEADERIPEATSFLIFGEYPTSFTPEEFAYARQMWRERTLGTKEQNDLSDPIIAYKIRQIEETCEKHLSRMNLQPDATVLFGEMRKPIESDELSALYYPLAAMAKAYGTPGCKYYKDPDLCEKIRYGMQWGYENMYGEAEFTNTGWRDTTACNWWHWMVGAPDPMTDVLITMEDEFTREEKERYLSLFVWFLTWRCNTDASAMTRVVVCTKTALILEKPEMLFSEYCDYNQTIRVGMGTSVRIDYTDWSHAMPYNVGYGQLKLDRSLYVAANLAGTAMQFRSPRTYNIFEMLKYTFGPAVYKCQAYVMLHGRNNHITEFSAGSKICVDTINMIGLFGEEEDAYIKGFIKRNAINQKLSDAMLARCGIANVKKLQSILDMPAPAPYNFAYAWFTGDRATQHRNGYAYGISMNSSRSKSYESILDMNKMGWYTTDGATYIYSDYDDGQYDGVNFMFNPEVAQRIPGTTEDVRIREARSVYDNPWYSETPFAGSITVNDEYALAAMEYVSEYFDGPEHGNTSGYGGTRGIFANDLFANKAWAMLDDELICIGSKINSTMNSNIVTSIEHRRIVEDENRDIIISVGGERRILPKENYAFAETGVDYIYMEGHGGFALDKAAKVYVRRYTSPECKDQPFIEFGYVHGENPVNEKYLYTALIGKSEDFVKEYSKKPPFEILAHSETVIAVSKGSLGVTSYVFFAPDRCERVETDSRLIVMRADEGGVTELRFSDVTHLLEKATVTFECENAEILDSSDKISARAEGNKAIIDIDFKESSGRPYFVKIKGKI